MPTEPTLSRRLARLMLARATAGLPEPVMERARLHALDNTAIALAAGPCLDICREVLEGLAFGGTSGGSRVWGQAQRLPPPQAAFANAALAHALDYDDIHDVARLHPTTVSLPSALAVAEAAGASVSTVLTPSPWATS